jgi:hypothetical protein
MREKLGLSVEGFAQAMGVAVSTATNWEAYNGSNRRPSGSSYRVLLGLEDALWKISDREARLVGNCMAKHGVAGVIYFGVRRIADGQITHPTSVRPGQREGKRGLLLRFAQRCPHSNLDDALDLLRELQKEPAGVV